MKISRTLKAMGLAGVLALGSLATTATAASADPGTTNCGPVVQVVCTKTFNRATTKDWHRTFHEWWFPVFLHAAKPGQVLLDRISGGLIELPDSDAEKALRRIVDATNEADDHNGCVQERWSKLDRRAPAEWTYTTGSECRY